MKRFSLFLIAMSWVLNGPLISFADGEHLGNLGNKMLGEVVKAEGAFVTVKDAHGKSRKFHVDKSTQLKGKIMAGAKVEVESTDRGHAISMRVKD